MRLVTIEFIKDTEKRAAGQRLRVDPMSAESFVDRKKVAKRVDASAPVVAEPVKPAPKPVDEGDN
jgi:hypothetical protein